MAPEKIRRLVLVIAAVALFLATVMPGIGISMADSSPAAIATDSMHCPDCDTPPDKMAGCMQATCLTLAVMADGSYFDVSVVRPTYAMDAAVWPDDFTSAPPTPPI